jgi:hypothetical protein
LLFVDQPPNRNEVLIMNTGQELDVTVGRTHVGSAMFDDHYGRSPINVTVGRTHVGSAMFDDHYGHSPRKDVQPS